MEIGQTINAQSTVHGDVKDTAGLPVPAANILLLRAIDSVLVKGTVSLASGEFSFMDVPAGRYLTTATCAGYLQTYSSTFDVKNSDLQKHLGTIRLTENKLDLKAVVVSARKPLLEQKIDRLIVNVENSITSAGGTALQILERLPGIIVDQQNNLIVMNGKDGVMLMINGKITQMPASAVVQMLAGMSADNIEKIELITTPPANLNAEGNAGFINIVLKTNNLFGTNGSYSATLGYSVDLLTQGSLNINNRKGRVNVYGQLSFSDIKNKLTADTYTKISSNDTINEVNWIADRIGRITNFEGRLGVDIDVSKRTIAGILVSGRSNTYSMDENNRNDIYKNQRIDTVVRLANDEVNSWTDYSANLNLQHDLEKKGKISLNLDYIHYINDQEVNYRKKFYDSSGVFVYPQNSRTNKYTPIDFWIGSLDYSVSLSDKVILETGFKQTISTLTNDISFENEVGNLWIKDKSFSAVYSLREQYPAVYGSLNLSLNKTTNVKMGLRYEYTVSRLGAQDTSVIIDRKYGNLFPTIFVSHKLAKNTSLNISYNQRITRPTFSNLAPFTYFVSPSSAVTGNPTLQPSINNTVKLDVVVKQFLFSLAIGKETNSITGFQPDPDSIRNRIIYSPQNLKNKKSISGIFSLPVTINSWWTMQFNITANLHQVNAIYRKQDIRLVQRSATINAIQRFTLPKKYFLELTGFYQSPYLDGLLYRAALGSLDIGFKKLLPGNYGTVSLNATNILNTMEFRREWDMPAQNLVGYFYMTPARGNVKLTYSKNFGKEKLKEKRARVTGADDAKSRVE
ncbi:outer membrane beta-barrel protein [Flavitalea antarctica]